MCVCVCVCVGVYTCVLTLVIFTRFTPIAYCVLFYCTLMSLKFFCRLGGGDRGASETMDHAFYSSINWQDIYDRKASKTSQLFL